jgi:hypothetical protein
MSTLVYLADAAFLSWVLYLIVRPWIRARRLRVRLSLFSVFRMRVDGVPPLLLLDAYVTQRNLRDEIPLSVIESAWRANCKNIRHARDLARYARDTRNRLAAA